MDVTAAEHRLQDGLNTALQAAFHLGGKLQLGGIQIAPGAVGLGQQMTELIDDGDVTWRQAGDAAGDHIDDGIDLAII